MDKTKEVAEVLGISADLLRWRIKSGKYPDARRDAAGRRLFSIEDVLRLAIANSGGRASSMEDQRCVQM